MPVCGKKEEFVLLLPNIDHFLLQKYFQLSPDTIRLQQKDLLFPCLTGLRPS